MATYNVFRNLRSARSVARRGKRAATSHPDGNDDYELPDASTWQASNQLEGQPSSPSQHPPAHFQSDTVAESSRQAARRISPHGSNQPAQETLRRRTTGRLSSTDNNAASNPRSNEPRTISQRLLEKARHIFERATHWNPFRDFKRLTAKEPFTWRNQLHQIFIETWWIKMFMIMIPIGIALDRHGSISRVAVFVVNFFAIVPLAALLGSATEEIALRTGEAMGGLLNATFGNAVELIVALFALFKNEIVIVQTSLIGSILSNLLLVLGCCFIWGGKNRQEQYFNTTVAQTAASMLALSVAGVIVPTVFDIATGSKEHVAKISRGTSIILLVVYGAYLLFQLKTHSSVFAERSRKVEARHFNFRNNLPPHAIATGFAAPAGLMGGVGMSSIGREESEKLRGLITSPPMGTIEEEEEQEEAEEPKMHGAVALGVLVAATVLIAICAEAMVDSISAITHGGPLTDEFVGLILLPIVGNAAEHYTAVSVAGKDKMDLAINVAVGSSMQVALFVIPLLVLAGWNKPEMNLSFDSFQVAVLFVAVLLVNYLIADGKSHWLEGVLLISLYAVIGVCAWFYPDENASPATGRAG